ncbi:MAG: hypothetical protein LBT45_01890 [Rickettsiales bacterium]|jgi:hypothetical protein|nr:hypothetical protein [Rickettsiales bacterium]
MEDKTSQKTVFSVYHPNGNIDVKSSGDKCGASVAFGLPGCPARGMVEGFWKWDYTDVYDVKTDTYKMSDLGNACREQLKNIITCICAMCRMTNGQMK